MRRVRIVTAFLSLTSVGACAHYDQEVAALRMARPAAEPELAAYAAPDASYPSVGGDILKGTSPTAGAAYDATSGGRVPPPADARP